MLPSTNMARQPAGLFHRCRQCRRSLELRRSLDSHLERPCCSNERGAGVQTTRWRTVLVPSHQQLSHGTAETSCSLRPVLLSPASPQSGVRTDVPVGLKAVAVSDALARAHTSSNIARGCRHRRCGCTWSWTPTLRSCRVVDAEDAVARGLGRCRPPFAGDDVSI